MKRVICLALLVSTLVGLTALSACRSSQSASPEMAKSTQRMESYLLASYDSALDLVRESPNANPNVYWLYSDNYLASLALKEAEPDIASAIVPAIDGYQFRPSKRWAVLGGQAVPDDLFAMGVIPATIARQESREIRSEIPSPLFHMDDWQEYADRLLLAAINASNRGDRKEARRLFEKAQGMFDGLGFKDKAFTVRGYYDTYKLALYLLAAERISIQVPERQWVISLILSLQEKDPASNCYGGVYTEYDEDGKALPHSDTNTETASLALLALK